MAILDLSTVSFRSYNQGIDDSPANLAAHGSPTTKINLSSIKYRAKISSGLTSIGGFPSYESMNASDSYALIIPGTPTISVTSIAVSTGSGIIPLPTISVGIPAAVGTASSVFSIILTGSPDAPAAESIASMTIPVVFLSVTAQTTATATNAAPTLAISTISPIAISTASITTPVVLISVETQSFATASSIASTPNITIESVSSAIASIVTPVILGDYSAVAPASESTALSISQTPVISVISVAISTASVSIPTISII